MRLAWAANESQFYSSRFGQSRLNRFYQPKARYKNRPDSKLGSVRLEIAARLKARFFFFFFALNSMTLLDLARAGHCRSGLGSPRLVLTRLGSARLATRVRLHPPLLAQAQLGAPYLDWGINSMLDSAQLGVWLGVRSRIGWGLATRDLAWLGSEESELSSSHLDRSIARPIWSRLISVRKLL